MEQENKKFFSTTEMIRHHFDALLSDGKEHETNKIQKYILSKTKGKRLDGGDITQSMIASAIREAVIAPNSRMHSVRRGCYQLREYNAESVLANMAIALIRAKREFDNNCIVDFTQCKITGDELSEIQNAVKKIDGLFDQAVEVINSAETDMQEDSGMSMTM